MKRDDSQGTAPLDTTDAGALGASSPGAPLDVPSAATPLARRPLPAGKLGTYAALGAAAGAVPIPWLPGAIARRVRGALVHDLAARRGLSLDPEARAVLAEPTAGPGRGVVGKALGFAAGRVLGRIGPLALLGPTRAALATFTLGHLFERYLARSRTDHAARIDADEARRVRHAIDAALTRALSSDVVPEAHERPAPAEELRNASTKITDGLIIGAASLPGWLVERLDAAFDDLLAASPPSARRPR